MKRTPQSRRVSPRAVALAGCAIAAAMAATGGEAGAQEPVIAKGSALYSPGHILADSMVRYGEAVTAASDGNVQFEWFYSDSLVKPTEIAVSLADGILDIAYVTPAYTPANFPADKWVSLLGYGNDPRPVVGLLSAGAAMMEFGFSEPGIVGDLLSVGIYPLLPRFQNWDNYRLLCKEPVTTLADARGRRVRVGGDAFVRAAQSLGMSPVTLSGAEIYEGLDRGIVDCFIGGEGDMVGLGLWDIARNYTAILLPGWNSTAIGLGADFFESLNPESQQAFIQQLPSYVEVFFADYLKSQYRFFAEGPEKHGTTIIQPADDLKQAIEAHYASIRDVMLQEAPPSIPDPAASIARYEELRDKWTKIVLDLGYDPGVSTHPEWVAANPGGVDVDLTPWVQAVREQIFDVYLPLKTDQ